MMDNNFYSPYCQHSISAVMKIVGVGSIKADPDIALINLGVITENQNLKAAQEENAKISANVINALLSSGVLKKDISTSSYTIEPQYDYIEGKQVFRNYRVSNILTVTVTDIAKIGEVIDSATAAGVNRVDQVSFKVSNGTQYYNKAIKLALNDAKIKARELGNSMGVDVSALPYKIIETSSPSAGEDVYMLKTVAASTAIFPGQSTITARLEVHFYY